MLLIGLQQDLAREHPGVTTVLDSDHAVDQHELYPRGIAVGVGVGSVIGDGARVEDHDIGLEAC